jgi:hypothetical protein
MDMLEPTEETTFPVCGRMCHDVRMSKAWWNMMESQHIHVPAATDVRRLCQKQACGQLVAWILCQFSTLYESGKLRRKTNGKPRENQEFRHLDLFRNFSLFDIFRHFSTFKFWPFGDILDMSSLPGSLCWNQLESWLPSRCAPAEVRTHWKQPSETGSDAPWSSKERHRKTVWKTAKNCIQSLKRMFTQSIAVKSDKHVRQKKHLGSGTKSPKLPEYLWNNYTKKWSAVAKTT